MLGMVKKGKIGQWETSLFCKHYDLSNSVNKALSYLTKYIALLLERGDL